MNNIVDCCLEYLRIKPCDAERGERKEERGGEGTFRYDTCDGGSNY